MLYFLLTFAVLFILAQAWLLWKFTNRITELEGQRDKALKDYESLDQGMVELSDAYETDCLQYESSLEKLNEEKARLSENNSTLIHNAMIDRTARREQERQLHQKNEEIAHLRRQLDIAQVVISEHDLNCLPHIVLKSMEPKEQDTPLPL